MLNSQKLLDVTGRCSSSVGFMKRHTSQHDPPHPLMQEYTPPQTGSRTPILFPHTWQSRTGLPLTYPSYTFSTHPHAPLIRPNMRTHLPEKQKLHQQARDTCHPMFSPPFLRSLLAWRLDLHHLGWRAGVWGSLGRRGYRRKSTRWGTRFAWVGKQYR